MPKPPTNYPYIRAWGKMLHSFPYYIEAQVERAEAEGAPVNAIYRANDGWHTADTIASTGTKAAIESLAKRICGVEDDQ